MQHRPLGQSGIEASVVALGAWAIGGWNWGPQDDAQSIRAIHAAIDAGIDLIDTAPVYGFGRSEDVVGRAIADRRDRVILATKCGMRWDTQRGRLFFRSDDDEIREDGDKAVHIYNGPESVRMEVEASLRRLGVDTIDLIQTHWQDETTPIADTMGELMKLKEEGKVRAIGVCNASIPQIEAYRAIGFLRR
ncbi:MAG: aldo/keto reductase, partial [Planctomycetes bacterium]|nr:aldo/keto reductase [Planctomycetota bacterium]